MASITNKPGPVPPLSLGAGTKMSQLRPKTRGGAEAPQLPQKKKKKSESRTRQTPDATYTVLSDTLG
jgi:hypothetical protein